MNNVRPRFGSRPAARRRIWILIVTPFLGSCSDSSAPLLAFWGGDLNPIRPSLVSGRVVAVSQHGKTDIGINIQEGEAGATYGWRIDSGSCDEPGSIRGGPASYPPLVASQGGSASAEASVAALFKPGKLFAARVYLPTGPGTEQIVACGNLEETSG